MTTTEAIAKVRTYADLPDNWDTYQGYAASPQAIEFAVKLLERLESESVPVPLVQPIDTGVYMEWTIGDAKAYFEIDATGLLFAVDNSYEDATFDVDKAVKAVLAHPKIRGKESCPSI